MNDGLNDTRTVSEGKSRTGSDLRCERRLPLSPLRLRRVGRPRVGMRLSDPSNPRLVDRQQKQQRRQRPTSALDSGHSKNDFKTRRRQIETGLVIVPASFVRRLILRDCRRSGIAYRKK